MKRIFISGFLLFFIVGARFSYALDWKALHEKADEISLARALSEVNLNLSSINNLYILGLVYINEHKDREAGEVFNKIIALNPKIIEARWGLAEVLRREHRIEENERILNEIIRTNPGFSPAYITLAYVKYTQMDFEKTVWLAFKVIKQGRDNVDLSNYTRAYLLLAGAKGMIASRGGPLSKLINGTTVLPNLKKAQMLQPNSQVVMFSLGSFYFLAPAIAGGDIDKAGDYFKKAVAIDPLFADAYVRLAQVYKVQGNSAKSEKYLRKAREIDPENALLRDFEQKNASLTVLRLKNSFIIPAGGGNKILIFFYRRGASVAWN